MEDYPIPFYPDVALFVQYLSWHIGVVKDVKDQEGRGRVRVMVPGLLGKGKKNWSGWIDTLNNPIGGTSEEEADQGTWNPLQPGQMVFVGFASGDPEAKICLPGFACQSEKGKDKQLTPKEAKKVGKKDPRERTRLRIVKSESGDTVLIDDRGKKEKRFAVDWTGAGDYVLCPGKVEDEKEKKDEESKPRKGERRGMKLVATKTSKKPKELIEGGVYLRRLCDLNGGGAIFLAGNKNGLVVIFAAPENGEVGPSLVLDAKNNNAYVTAGKVQLQVLGSKGHIAGTRFLIQEQELVDVEKPIKKLIEAFEKGFEEFKEE